MRIVLSGGGTAGHINPALALAQTLQQRGHEVLYAGTPTGVEARLVAQAGLPFRGFESKGFDRAKPTSLITGTRTILKSTGDVKRWFDDIKPDVVVAFGGYVCLPVARAAHALDIPVVVHEQNSVMGMANTYLSKTARAVALTYEEAGKDVKDTSKIVITGNPVRAEFFNATKQQGREMLGIPEDAFMLLVFGGSLGARHINEAITRLKHDILSVSDEVYVVHITGPKEYDSVCEQLSLTEKEKQRYIVMGYQNRMAETMAAADAIVSRAGATSLAEISARCVPALLVPYPYATANHQCINAQAYVDRGAAYMMMDDKLDSEEFEQQLHSLLCDAHVRDSMKEAAATFETENAAEKLADVVLDVASAR